MSCFSFKIYLNFHFILCHSHVCITIKIITGKVTLFSNLIKIDTSRGYNLSSFALEDLLAQDINHILGVYIS